MQIPDEKIEAHCTPREDFKRSIDATFLTLVEHGCVGTHPNDLVIATLQRLMAEAHALHADDDPARRWRSA